MYPDVELLKSIRTFTSLVKYLQDKLDWPIESDDFDDLTFDYEPEELGIDIKTAVKIKEIKQLRPLSSKQPWGIFFINFEPKQLPIVVLRRILRSLVVKKRASANKSQQAAWQLHDLLFISSYGEAEHCDITFAHFIEKWGREIKLILLKEPDAQFSEVGTKFVTTFKRRSYYEGEKVVEKGNEGLVEGLVENQKKILELVKENPQISKNDLSKKIGISATAIDKNIDRLKEKGLLKRIGPDKGGYWEVVRK